MDIISTLEKYSLTLRHFPEKEVGYTPDHGQPLRENEERVNLGYWKDGSDKLMVKQTRVRIFPAWICYVTDNWHSIQNWTKSFMADTAEDAVKQAVEFIESRNNHE